MLTISPVCDNIALAAGSVKGRTKPSIFRALVGWFRLEWEVVRGRGSAGRSLVGWGRGSLVGGKAGVPDPSPLPLHACYSPLTCWYGGVKFKKDYFPLLKCTMGTLSVQLVLQCSRCRDFGRAKMPGKTGISSRNIQPQVHANDQCLSLRRKLCIALYLLCKDMPQ